MSTNQPSVQINVNVADLFTERAQSQAVKTLANWTRQNQSTRNVMPKTISMAERRARQKALQRVNLFHRATISHAGVKRHGPFVAAQLDQ